MAKKIQVNKKKETFFLKSRVNYEQFNYILERMRTEGKTQSNIIREIIESDKATRKNT